MLQSTTPAKKLMAQTHLNFCLMLGSQMDMTIEALTNHRDYYFGQMFDEIKNEEYENAHRHYQRFKNIGYILDQMLLDLADLASGNYAAATYKGDAQAQVKRLDADVDRSKESYKEFLNMILCRTSDKAE